MELREPCNGGRQTISCCHDAGWPICRCGTEGASLLTDRTTGEGLPIPYKLEPEVEVDAMGAQRRAGGHSWDTAEPRLSMVTQEACGLPF